jgi:hypothetical protein
VSVEGAKMGPASFDSTVAQRDATVTRFFPRAVTRVSHPDLPAGENPDRNSSPLAETCLWKVGKPGANMRVRRRVLDVHD